MSSQLTANIQTFIQKLDGLKDWPDKMAITELSAITERNIGFAEHFAKILVAKLTDPRTHSTYKLPIFYVIDSIMKHVGGPFAVLFATQFAECYPQAVAELHEKDRGRLSFLLDTWKERRFMSPDLLSRMKSAANATPLVPATVANNTAPRAGPTAQLAAPGRPLSVAQPQHNAPRTVVPQRTAAVAQVHHHPPTALSGPAATAVHARSVPALAPATANAVAPVAVDPFAAGMFADLVQNEMVAMLAQMYAEMGVSNPMSLEQLRAANPPLYDQIRAKAEERARAVLAQRQQAASPQMGQGAPRGYPGGYPPTASPQSVYPTAATANYNRKRPADYPPQQQQAHSGQQWGPPAQYPRQDQPIAHYSSRFNASGHQYSAAPHGAGPDFNDALSAEQQEAAKLAAQHRREEEARYFEELRVKYASDHFVNGFLNEAPVVVDIARVQALADVLRCQYSNTDSRVFENNLNHTIGSVHDSSETAPGVVVGTMHVKLEGSADVSTAPGPAEEAASAAQPASQPPQPALPLSSGFLAAARTVTHRLDAYLRDVHTPPRLPPVLFGPLPLAPIYGQSAEALDELDRQQRAKATASATVAQSRPVARKLPVPPFRTEELGRNPERAVAAMYGDKPHQFHEDGLRFRSLAELKQHTDKHMELKKLLLKRAAVREYRDWYCTSAQWITDFSALSVAGTSTGAAGSGAASSSSSSGAGKASGGGGGAAPGKDAQEEYILPADEHFTRCPVSREVFECVWDGAEGEMMYRNAVKVLVTEAADPALFRLAQPVPWEDGAAGSSAAPPVRYLIVHKLLVLDPWLAAGKAVPLQDALIRYKTAVNGGQQGQAKADRLAAAVGQDDDEEDVFVLLEFGNT